MKKYLNMARWGVCSVGVLASSVYAKEKEKLVLQIISPSGTVKTQEMNDGELFTWLSQKRNPVVTNPAKGEMWGTFPQQAAGERFVVKQSIDRDGNVKTKRLSQVDILTYLSKKIKKMQEVDVTSAGTPSDLKKSLEMVWVGAKGSGLFLWLGGKFVVLHCTPVVARTMWRWISLLSNKVWGKRQILLRRVRRILPHLPEEGGEGDDRLLAPPPVQEAQQSTAGNGG